MTLVSIHKYDLVSPDFSSAGPFPTTGHRTPKEGKGSRSRHKNWGPLTGCWRTVVEVTLLPLRLVSSISSCAVGRESLSSRTIKTEEKRGEERRKKVGVIVEDGEKKTKGRRREKWNVKTKWTKGGDNQRRDRSRWRLLEGRKRVHKEGTEREKVKQRQ